MTALLPLNPAAGSADILIRKGSKVKGGVSASPHWKNQIRVTAANGLAKLRQVSERLETLSFTLKQLNAFYFVTALIYCLKINVSYFCEAFPPGFPFKLTQRFVFYGKQVKNKNKNGRELGLSSNTDCLSGSRTIAAVQTGLGAHFDLLL